MTSPFSARSIALVVLVACSFATPAPAALLWYNGDNDNRDTLDNYSKIPVNLGSPGSYLLTSSLVYDNFIVPTGQVWTVTSVFSDNLMSYNGTPTSATWQIRQGLSAGNAGTLVASGDSTATYTTLTAYNPATGLTEERVTATVASLTLTAGAYWVAVAPDSLGYYADQSYIETTSGANAVGLPQGNDGNSFVTNVLPSTAPNQYNFTPTTTALDGDGDGPNIDFSIGVAGTVVPEPASIVMVALGLISPSLVLLRRGLASRRTNRA